MATHIRRPIINTIQSAFKDRGNSLAVVSELSSFRGGAKLSGSTQAHLTRRNPISFAC
jgi:hypothetical protein